LQLNFFESSDLSLKKRILCVYMHLQVEADLRITCYDGRAKAPLHLAAQESNADTVHTLLLWCSANVQLTDSSGETALHYAVCRPVDTLGTGTRDQSAVVETVRILLGFSVPVGLFVNFLLHRCLLLS
jgi:hypothetical protein